MSAAEYYGSPGGGGKDGRTEGVNVPGRQRPYPESRYSSQGALPYPSSSHNIDTTYSSYDPHSLNHSPSPASHTATHPDPFADNIPLQETGKSKKHRNSKHSNILPFETDKHNSVYSEHETKKRRKKIGWVSWGLAIIQIGIFIGELAKNAILTKSPIATKPVFNPMIGPSNYVLINMGARFIPCMKEIEDRKTGTSITNNPALESGWFCPNSTTPDTYKCTLGELCGMSGTPKDSTGLLHPNQWYRFITPIFLHAGVIHIAFNMLLQLRLGVDMEREIGPIRYAIVYFASGIFGFILGGNYAPNGQSSMGASGCLFGIIALVLLDILYCWKELKNPMRDLFWIVIQIVVSFVLGLLPGLDNFSHIGGFVMGLMLGLTLMRSPKIIARRINSREPPYTPVAPTAHVSGVSGGASSFVKSPKSFFIGRKPMWWAWWLVRAGTLIAAIVVFVVLLNNFYVYRKECSWCKYLSCIPVSNWCKTELFEFNLQETTPTSAANQVIQTALPRLLR